MNYKAGYDIGPANPFPQNKPEAEIFEAQKVIDAKVEAFEELKAESERRKKEVEEKWIEEGKMSVDQPELADKPYSPPDPAKLDPDNPDNYFMPPEDDSGRLPDDFGKDAKIVAPPGEEDVDHLKARYGQFNTPPFYPYIVNILLNIQWCMTLTDMRLTENMGLTEKSATTEVFM